MSKPMPEHHREITIPRAWIAKGYSGTIVVGSTPCIVVSASPVDAKDAKDAGMVRVIVAPARVPT